MVHLKNTFCFESFSTCWIHFVDAVRNKTIYLGKNVLLRNLFNLFRHSSAFRNEKPSVIS